MNREEARSQMERWQPGDEIRLAQWKASDRFFFKQWYKRNKLSVKDSGLKSKYGINLEFYNKMYREQGGRCANKACDMEFDATARSKRPHVDHDHKTLKIRGLLCQNCNIGIGCFKDNPSVLVGAAAYLQQPPLN